MKGPWGEHATLSLQYHRRDASPYSPLLPRTTVRERGAPKGSPAVPPANHLRLYSSNSRPSLCRDGSKVAPSHWPPPWVPASLQVYSYPGPGGRGRKGAIVGPGVVSRSQQWDRLSSSEDQAKTLRTYRDQCIGVLSSLKGHGLPYDILVVVLQLGS